MVYYSYLTLIKEKSSGAVLAKYVSTSIWRKSIDDLKLAAVTWATCHGHDRNNIKIEVSKL